MIHYFARDVAMMLLDWDVDASHAPTDVRPVLSLTRPNTLSPSFYPHPSSEWQLHPNPNVNPDLHRFYVCYFVNYTFKPDTIMHDRGHPGPIICLLFCELHIQTSPSLSITLNGHQAVPAYSDAVPAAHAHRPHQEQCHDSKGSGKKPNPTTTTGIDPNPSLDPNFIK